MGAAMACRKIEWKRDHSGARVTVMESNAEPRLDKWLWAVRLFKTRAMAMEACKGGHVKMDGHNLKPAHTVRVGQVIAAHTGQITRTVKVVKPIDRRVGPAIAAECYEELTPASEFLKQIEMNKPSDIPRRPKGSGRPTKKERRQLEELL